METAILARRRSRHLHTIWASTNRYWLTHSQHATCMGWLYMAAWRRSFRLPFFRFSNDMRHAHFNSFSHSCFSFSLSPPYFSFTIFPFFLRSSTTHPSRRCRAYQILIFFFLTFCVSSRRPHIFHFLLLWGSGTWCRLRDGLLASNYGRELVPFRRKLVPFTFSCPNRFCFLLSFFPPF